MATKRRCTQCRQYFPPEGMYRSGISGVCSLECLRDLQDKYRRKRARRIVHKERRVRYGRRLPGATRERVRNRDGHRCRYCGTVNDLQIHHIEYRSQGGSDALHNLILLCEQHHQRMHSSKMYWQPILRGAIWLDYVEKKHLTIPEVEKFCLRRGLIEREARAA